MLSIQIKNSIYKTQLNHIHHFNIKILFLKQSAYLL